MKRFALGMALGAMWMMISIGGTAWAGGGSSVGDGPARFTPGESRALIRTLAWASGRPLRLEYRLEWAACSMTVVPGFPTECDFRFEGGWERELTGTMAREFFDILRRHYEPKDPHVLGSVTIETFNMTCRRASLLAAATCRAF